MKGESKKRVLFYYLSAFSNTGGIEKFNQCFIKAMNDLRESEKIIPQLVSVYDRIPDNKYTEKASFRGFKKNRFRSALFVLSQVAKTEVLVLGHINLLPIGLLVKLICPRCQIILVAHGIEVWKKFSLIERWCIKKNTRILAVSTYTKNQIVLRNNIDAKTIQLFPNTLDPFLKVPHKFGKPDYLRERYGLKQDQPVILTLCRLLWSEKNKGYDKVISSLPLVLQKYPNTVYILGGKFDEREKQRIDALISLYNIQDNIIMPGYISDQEKVDHYLLSDVFVLPSRKEGFGIVFLEALACGTSVIGGNQDGTVDALRNGTLGHLVNPTKSYEIAGAIIDKLSKGPENHETLQKKVLSQYEFSRYKDRLSSYLMN